MGAWFALYIYAVGFMSAAMRATSRDSNEEHPIRYAAFWPFTAAIIPLLRYEAQLLNRRALLKASKETQRLLASPKQVVEFRNCYITFGPPGCQVKSSFMMRPVPFVEHQRRFSKLEKRRLRWQRKVRMPGWGVASICSFWMFHFLRWVCAEVLVGDDS